MTDALLELASWYESGSIVARDQRAADSLLSLAVRSGSREAEVRKIMGSMKRGGAPEDLTAMADTLLAAERDASLLAQAIIGRCYEKGAGFPLSIPRAVASYRKAAQRGSRLAYDALKVLYRLKDAGYQAYLVGGGVRDLLLGRRPKDFDVGTSAHPYQVKKLFRNCWIIGRRFRLAHVKFGPTTVEVATFRRHVPAGTEVVC